MINTPLVIGMLAQCAALILFAVHFALHDVRHHRERRMVLIAAIGLALFGVALIDMEVLLP
jgi:hypothetical protein